MKKLYFVFIFFIFCGFSIFGNNDNKEEVGYLLFMPNSGTRFANEEQAFIQLNNLAKYLSDKNLKPGQIVVYGYAASAPNNFKSDDLSIERALTVIEELQKRGISKDLFADPVGHGAVYLWGGNTSENDRKLNRRVRIFLDPPIPVTQEVITAGIETPKAKAPAAETHRVDAGKTLKKETVPQKYSLKYPQKKTNFKFFWWLLPLLAILLLFFLLLLLFKESSGKPAQKAGTAKAEPPVSQTGIVTAFAPVPVPEPEPEPAPDFIPSEAVTTWTVNLDDEIRFRAYELSIQRDEQGDYREQDWYNAVREISAWYKASGHSVFTDGGCWWASRSYSW